MAPSKHRNQMIKLALKPLMNQANWIHLDEWESKQDHWIRTLEVLQHHSKKLENQKDSSKEKIRLMLLCGSDMFESFNLPNLWQDDDIETIVRDFGILIIHRDISDPWKTLNDSEKSKILLKYKVLKIVPIG